MGELVISYLGPAPSEFLERKASNCSPPRPFRGINLRFQGSRYLICLSHVLPGCAIEQGIRRGGNAPMVSFILQSVAKIEL